MSNEPIRISHPRLVQPVGIQTEGIFEEKNGQVVSYLQETDKSGLTSLIIQLSPDNNHFNRIELHPLTGEHDAFPDAFRIEMSQDGKYWEPIIQESGYKRAQKTVAAWNFSLTSAKYVKFIGKITRRTDSGKFRLAFGQFLVMISGITKIDASSEADRLRVKENLIDTRPDYGWASLEKSEPSEEFLTFDLSAIHRIEELRLLSKKDEETNFPEKFTVFYSEDDLSWHQLMEEPTFMAEPGTWYRWRFLPVNARFVKIICKQERYGQKTKYLTEIIEVEFFASADAGDSEKSSKTQGPLPYASVLRSGMVRLAVDGETREGVAVQGSDRRLRESTTEYKGIVELATDGEDRQGVVVQGNDRRLKEATELAHGLTRLARSGESKSGVVIQGNDERLRKATTENPGIVELASDGETRPEVVVQGNDRRLRRATFQDPGLVILAQANETIPGKVVTGDDPRLRDATTEAKGIVKLASNGDESPLSAVQGNDKRLRVATTENLGIVQLARSGESKSGVVVQGDDKRLKTATVDDAGIVTIALDGSSTPGKVVSSDDKRLSDSRLPLPHEHNYAPKDHDYASHTGLIRLTGNVASPFQGIFPPPNNHSAIFGKNENPEGAGISAVGGRDGVIGFGDQSGVFGMSGSTSQSSSGILGISKAGYGGVFASQSGYAIHASGNGIPERNVPGSNKAVFAEGDSVFKGSVAIHFRENTDCIARIFQLDTRDVVGVGDLLITTDEPGKLAKSKNPYATNVIGVLVSHASLVLGAPKKNNNDGLVAVFGVVMLNVDPSMGNIQPGDLLVSGLVGGYAVKADPNKIKPGCLVAKALEPSKKERGSILVMLSLG
ncbi:discoidin domain-containing protein [Leptospira sp. GIMC2001]|uniref:discoidin domain-containing protein n=1 Tax=Leptospira sp. GIMC2001 TaxID=1513297 RepID=UPI00234AA968|nr:discoidin domain-containing protein [Leptospira sp. GIMC2001]WCL47829.1 discoidin domain-containing protein [Leptospira sp. GIMC2001]